MKTFRKAIVIGASSGIGAALARDLARGGADVALVARRADELARVVDSIRRTSGAGSVSAYVHDVTRFDDTAATFERIVIDLGGLDTVVYAAGAMPHVDESEWDFVKDRATIEVNLLGAMAWMNLAAARFEAAQEGTLIGISSIAGVRGRRGNPAYCTSKAALTTYLESLRNRLSRHGVNVVTIEPGFVDTAMTRGKPGLFWVISPERASSAILDLARSGRGASAFVPARWGLVAAVVRALPSVVFRRLSL